MWGIAFLWMSGVVMGLLIAAIKMAWPMAVMLTAIGMIVIAWGEQ